VPRKLRRPRTPRKAGGGDYYGETGMRVADEDDSAASAPSRSSWMMEVLRGFNVSHDPFLGRKAPISVKLIRFTTILLRTSKPAGHCPATDVLKKDSGSKIQDTDLIPSPASPVSYRGQGQGSRRRRRTTTMDKGLTQRGRKLVADSTRSYRTPFQGSRSRSSPARRPSCKTFDNKDGRVAGQGRGLARVVL